VRFLGAAPIEITDFQLPIGIGSFAELLDFVRTESYRFAPAVVAIEGSARARVEDIYRGGAIEFGAAGQGKQRPVVLDGAAPDFADVLARAEAGEAAPGAAAPEPEPEPEPTPEEEEEFPSAPLIGSPRHHSAYR
jgi:hypothetical protein